MADPANWLIPEPGTELLLLSIALCSLLGFLAYSKKVLDSRASILASIVGFVLIMYSDMFWFFILLIFLVLSYLVTVWKFGYKRSRGASEGRGGERGVKNVLANGSIPTIVAIMNEPIDSISDGLSGFLFLAAICIATADTFGSEIGIIANEPRMITSPKKKVEPGVDGGVSLLGNMAAAVGSLIIAVFGFIFVSDFLIDWGPHGMNASLIVIAILTLVGFIGCQVDSVLGATLQKTGILTNNTVNFATIALGVIISIPVYLLISLLV